MKTHKARFAFTLLLFCVILLFVATAFMYGPKARMIPLIIALASLALMLPVLINEVYPLSFVKKMEIDLLENYTAGSFARHAEETPGPSKLIQLFCWIIGFFIVIFLLGFHIGIAAFTFAFLKIEGKFRWHVSIIAAVITWGCIYAMFELAMGFRLFKGLFFGEIIPHI